MNEILKQIELCESKLNLFNAMQAKLGNEIRNYVNLNKLNTNLTTKEMYYNRNPLSDVIISKKLSIIADSENIIDYVENLINDSGLKNYIAVVLYAYMEDFNKIWENTKNYGDKFNNKLLLTIKKILKEKRFNDIVGAFFEISRCVIKYKKENPNIEFANNVLHAWLFYFLMFIDKYDDSMQCFNKIYVKEALVSLNAIKELGVNNNYISKKQIRELDNKCGEKAAVYNISEEYKTLKNLIKNYNSSFLKKEDIKPLVLITSQEKKTQEPKQKNAIPIVNREERKRLYNAMKNKHHPYLDEESTLTTDEIEYVTAYIDMVIEESISKDCNIDRIINILSEDGIENKNYMLIEIINKLKLKNTNSNINKVLISLNNILKKNFSKKMERKIKNDK